MKNGIEVNEDGTKSWWLNGLLHREDGPAVELKDGSKRWYLNGDQMSEEEFRIYRMKKNLEMIQ